MKKRYFAAVGGEARWMPKSTCILPPGLWLMLNEGISYLLLYDKYPQTQKLKTTNMHYPWFCRSGIWELPEWFWLMWLQSGLSCETSTELWLLAGLRSPLAVGGRPPFLAMSLYRAVSQHGT